MSQLDFRKAHFLQSASRLAACPPDEGLEVAFAGRSNAGKSSAINALTDNSKLARTSKLPGRTRLINFFALTPRLRLVDLPGYGYARVPQTMKAEWHRNLDEYLRERRSLRGLVLVMDIRHPLREFDREMLQWTAAVGLPTHALLTKADKLKPNPGRTTLAKVRRELLELSANNSVQLFSATKKNGLEELSSRLRAWLDETEIPAARP